MKQKWEAIVFWTVFTVIIFFAPKIFFLNFEKSEHLGFLGGYVGAILTLGGVWFQTERLEKHRKEEKKERERERKLGILKYLKFVLEENYKGGGGNGCAYTMQANLLYLTSWNSNEKEGDLFMTFKTIFIDNNLNVIMEFENNIGEDVLKMEMLISKVFKDYNFLLKNKKRGKSCLNLLKWWKI